MENINFNPNGIEFARSSASEIDSSILFTKEYLESANQNIDYINRLINGSNESFITNQVLDFTKDFTISFVARVDDVSATQIEDCFGIEDGTSYLHFGIIRTSGSRNVNLWIRDGATNYIKQVSIPLTTKTIQIIVSFSVATKKIIFSTNGDIQPSFTYTLAVVPTIPLALGRLNKNGVLYGTGIVMSDFVLFPFRFKKEDFKLMYSYFIKKWNITEFSIKSSWQYSDKLVVSEVVKKQNTLEHTKDFIGSHLFATGDAAIIGDSISKGLFCPDIKNTSWSNLFKNYLNVIYKNKNYGFDSIIYTLADYATMYHSVTTTAGWTTSAASNIYGLNGGETTGVINSEITFTISDLKEQKFFKANYVQDISAAFSCEVYVNNVLVGTDIVPSSGTSKLPYMGTIYTLTDNGSNGATIKLKVISGSAIVCGITYLNSTNYPTLNCYAESSRKTINIKEKTIEYLMANNKLVFWCLGQNDVTTGSDKDNAEVVIDKVVEYAVKYGVVVIFCDFLWTSSSSHFLKIKYQDAAYKLNNLGLYIDIPSSLGENGESVTTTYLTTKMGWQDSAHPKTLGHSFIFNRIKKELNL